MTRVLCIAVVLFLAAVSLAEGGSKHDGQTGSSDRWNPDSIGNAQAGGFSAETGSRWLTTIQADGRVRGMDSKGQPWTYDNRTGAYMNYGTGEVRHPDQK